MPAQWIRFVGPTHALEIAGIKLVGLNAQNGGKLLFSLLYVVVVLVLSRLLRWLARLVLRGRAHERVKFWIGQGINLTTAVLTVIGLVSIWFDDPTRLATAMGLVTAGLAFALQKVVTALAGYTVILRGKTFSIGDRIRMGGVRGDVIALSFIQTTIMEMGQPPEVQTDEPAMWVMGRQFTGRVVTLTNDKIFQEPVYNYTREFPFIWDEMRLPIPFQADHHRVEQILLDAAGRHTVKLEQLTGPLLEEMQRRYLMRTADIKPQVYYRLTSNWLEMTVRFLVPTHAIRELKSAMSLEILKALEAAGVGIASTTFEVVGL
ncbi:MAG TPA: mechanosensitive ion channel domain-containing protein, partial [Pirellulales bacterium]